MKENKLRSLARHTFLLRACVCVHIYQGFETIQVALMGRLCCFSAYKYTLIIIIFPTKIYEYTIHFNLWPYLPEITLAKKKVVVSLLLLHLQILSKFCEILVPLQFSLNLYKVCSSQREKKPWFSCDVI